MRRLTLRNYQSPGDLVCLTSALRDLHVAHPGAFSTHLDTSCPAVFEHNPFVSMVPGEVIECHYPLVKHSNECGLHMVNGFRMDLEDKLGVAIPQGPIRPDLYLSDEEKGQEGPFVRDGRPVWIINGGGKNDYTAKIWSHARYQQVIDATPHIHWVQVGTMEMTHDHPRLSGVTDLVGRTTLRQLIVLISKADGVLCPVTACMHIAAAFQKKCVVVAGGREPVAWERYEGHTFLHTIGQLDCCSRGGCWKSRTVSLHDGMEFDEKLCTYPTEAEYGQVIPLCLSMITAEMVCAAIQGVS